MAIIQFTEKQVKYAKTIPAKPTKKQKNRKTFRCAIDGYNLYIGEYKVTRTWAIKFAKWILKSFDKYEFD